MEDILSISYKFDELIEFQMREALWQESEGTYFKRYVGGLIAGLLALPYFLYQKSQPYGANDQSDFSFVVLGGLAFLVSLFKLFQYQQEKRDFFHEFELWASKMRVEDGRITVCFSDEGVSYQDPFKNVTTRWSDFYSFYVIEGYIFIAPNEGERLIFSKDNFGEENFNTACAKLEMHLKGGKSKARNRVKKRRDDILDD